MDESVEMLVEVAHPTLNFIQPRALKALRVHPLLGVSEQRQILINGIGHGRFTREYVRVIEAFFLGTPAMTGVPAVLAFWAIGALGQALHCVSRKALKREFVEIALVGVGGVGAQPQ